MELEKDSSFNTKISEYLSKPVKELYEEAYENAYGQFRFIEKRYCGKGVENKARKTAWRAVVAKCYKGEDNIWYIK